MACGRPLITARTTTSERLTHLAEYQAFHVVDTYEPEHLAELIASIENNRDSLLSIGKNARIFYESFLSEECIRTILKLHLTAA